MIIKLTTVIVQYEYYDTDSESWDDHDIEERIEDMDVDVSTTEHRIILSREIVNKFYD